MNKHCTNGTCIHVVDQLHHVGITSVLVVGSHSPVDRFSIGADLLVDGVYNHLYIGVIASANNEGFSFVCIQFGSGFLNSFEQLLIGELNRGKAQSQFGKQGQRHSSRFRRFVCIAVVGIAAGHAHHAFKLEVPAEGWFPAGYFPVLCILMAEFGWT